MNPAFLDRLLWSNKKTKPLPEQTYLGETALAKVRYRDSGGSEQAIVFLCDPPVTVEAYDGLIKRLAPDYRVLVMELPGFGHSKPRSSKAYEFLAAVEAIESLLLQLNVGPAILCAPCICGFVATSMVQRGKANVAGLVLMQTPDLKEMRAWVDRMDPKGLLRVGFLGQLVVRATASRITRFWFKYATAKQFDQRSLVEMTLNASAAYPLATMLQRWSRHLTQQSSDIPALAIWGKQDRSHRDTPSESSLQHVPGAEIVEFEQCGHFSELEDPDAFLLATRHFFSSLKTNVAGNVT